MEHSGQVVVRLVVLAVRGFERVLVALCRLGQPALPFVGDAQVDIGHPGLRVLCQDRGPQSLLVLKQLRSLPGHPAEHEQDQCRGDRGCARVHASQTDTGQGDGSRDQPGACQILEVILDERVELEVEVEKAQGRRHGQPEEQHPGERAPANPLPLPPEQNREGQSGQRVKIRADRGGVDFPAGVDEVQTDG